MLEAGSRSHQRGAQRIRAVRAISDLCPKVSNLATRRRLETNSRERERRGPYFKFRRILSVLETVSGELRSFVYTTRSVAVEDTFRSVPNRRQCGNQTLSDLLMGASVDPCLVGGRSRTSSRTSRMGDCSTRALGVSFVCSTLLCLREPTHLTRPLALPLRPFAETCSFALLGFAGGALGAVAGVAGQDQDQKGQAHDAHRPREARPRLSQKDARALPPLSLSISLSRARVHRASL